MSHKVALAFKDWLPLVIQSIDAYVSSEDIQKGARWSPDVEKALVQATFGIICLTQDNLTAPWLNFEAGALSKVIANSQTNVCPFLFNIRQSSVEGPLSQFQSVRNERSEIEKLVTDINKTAKNEHERVKQNVLEQSFTAFWPRLHDALDNIAVQHSQSGTTPRRSSDDVLDEILEIVRSQQRLSATREELQDLEHLLDERVAAIEWSNGPLVKMEALRNMASGRTGPSNITFSQDVIERSMYGPSPSGTEIDNPVIPPSKPVASKTDSTKPTIKK